MSKTTSKEKSKTRFFDSKNQIQKIKHIKQFIYIFAILMLTFGIIGTSKYFKEWKSEGHNITSEAFYFESPELTSANASSPVSINSAEPDITFTLRNYVENNIDASEIPYDIEVYEGSNKLNYLSITDTGYNSGEHKMLAGVKTENTIKISGFRHEGEDSKNYNIKVTAKSPYKKVIEATYAIKHLNDVNFEVDTSNLPYIIVTARTNDYTGEKNYQINWNANNEIPDPTDGNLEKLWSGSGSSINCTFAPNTTYTYRFFKKADSASAIDFSISSTDVVKAKIGNKEYSTIQEAFNSISEGESIMLNDSATFSQNINISKSCTIDLNGSSLNNTASGYENINVFRISGNNTHVVLTDSKNGSTATLSSPYVLSIHDSATVTIYGGTYQAIKSAIDVYDSGKVIIYGGTFSGGYTGIETRYSNNINVDIYGGYFYSSASSNGWPPIKLSGGNINIYDCVCESGSSTKGALGVYTNNSAHVTLNIKNGTFKGNPSFYIGAGNNHTISLSGGAFSSSNNINNYLANGKTLNFNSSDNLYHIS